MQGPVWPLVASCRCSPGTAVCHVTVTHCGNKEKLPIFHLSIFLILSFILPFLHLLTRVYIVCATSPHPQRPTSRQNLFHPLIFPVSYLVNNMPPTHSHELTTPNTLPFLLPIIFFYSFSFSFTYSLCLSSCSISAMYLFVLFVVIIWIANPDPKKIYWSLNPQYLRMSPYLEIK
jgi:hypothetical protein